MENRENATNTQLSAPEACNYPRVVPSMPWKPSTSSLIKG
jgi:hypothetical protein